MIDTTVGGLTSNSYITVSEADSIITASGLSTTYWQDLSTNQSLRITGTVAGPFAPLSGTSDKMLLAVGEDGEDQEVTITYEGDEVSAEALCALLNDQVSGFTFSPNSDSTLSISVTEPTDTLYIKVTDMSAYSVLGIPSGTYIDEVTSVKEFLLQLSAQLVGYLSLRGGRYDIDQVLDFPRIIRSSDAENDPYIPEQVKEAQALLACLVVLPNFMKQVDLSNSILLPAAIQNAVVSQVKVAGIMDVKTDTSASANTGTTGTTNFLESIGNVFALPIYLRMKPFISQIRGGSLQPPTRISDDYLVNLLEDYGYDR